MKRGFSLIELVFVIAIVGILAAIAIPKLTTSRAQAQYAAINSDIQTIISSMQAVALTQDLSAQMLNGVFIMQTAGLSYSRWIAQGNGVRLASNGAVDLVNDCVNVDINQSNLNISVNAAGSNSSTLCVQLAKNYPQPLVFNLSNIGF